MYVIMRKLTEDQEKAVYKFEKDIGEKTEQLDRRNRPIIRFITITGICAFNKISHELTLDEFQTDSYFLKRPDQEIAWVGGQLVSF